MISYTLHCMLFFTPTPELTMPEQIALAACEQSYPQLSLCDEKLKSVKALSGDRYTVIASCGRQEAGQ